MYIYIMLFANDINMNLYRNVIFFGLLYVHQTYAYVKNAICIFAPATHTHMHTYIILNANS